MNRQPYQKPAMRRIGMGEWLTLVMDEALCWQETLRRLGYPAEQLFLAMDDRNVLVALRRDGKEFILPVGPKPPLSSEQLQAAWRAAVERWNKSSDADCSRIFERSTAQRRGSALAMELARQGFSPSEQRALQ